MDLPDRVAVLRHVDALAAAHEPTLDHGRARDAHPALCVIQVEGHDGIRRQDAVEAEQLMAEVVRRLDRLIRSGDVLGRIGPGRLVLAVHISPAVAGALAERVEGAVAMPLQTGGELISLVVTVGVAFADGSMLPWGVDSAAALLERAERDVALQQARRPR